MKEKKSKSKDLERPDLKKTKVKAKPNPTRKKVDLGVWSFENPVPAIQKGQKLRIETKVPAIVHWTTDEWRTAKDTPTNKNGRGKHIADLTGSGRKQKNILFTFYWPDAQCWENKNFEVLIIDS